MCAQRARSSAQFELTDILETRAVGEGTRANGRSCEWCSAGLHERSVVRSAYWRGRAQAWVALSANTALAPVVGSLA